MSVHDELRLLIKSRYPLVYFESIDENFSLLQLEGIAGDLGLASYRWSLTEGLRKRGGEGAYYRTQDPVLMLRTVLDLIGRAGGQEGLFVLKDFEKCLDNALTLRLFKDALNLAKDSRHTFVLLSPEYRLPKEIEPESAHIVGGYPEEDGILDVVRETVGEAWRTGAPVAFSLAPEELRRVAHALRGLSAPQIRNIVHQCILGDNAFTMDDLAEIERYKKRIFDREGLLEFCLTEDKENLAGFHSLRRWLAERRESFLRPSDALPPPRGILLMGVQGCGKSLAVKAVARELRLPLYRLDLGRLYSKYIGETEGNLRKALSVADTLRPLCLWIDEIEKGFAASAPDVDGGVSQRVLGTFLTWMQERPAGCFLAATANDVHRLPPEFLRKGRFDEVFFVDLPDRATRERLFDIHLRKRGLAPSAFDIPHLAELTPEFSGAEIEQAIISALYRASSEKGALTTAHVAEQAKCTKPLAVVKREDISALRQWARGRTVQA